jgi:dipeptidyl aminopeptidase/acylaminoacyl peptidase
MFRLFSALIVACAALVSSAVAAPSVESYGRLPAIENVNLSPSGDRYAYVAVDGEARKLIVGTVGSDKALYASSVGKAKVVSVTWAGEDRLLVAVSHTSPLGLEYTRDKEEDRAVLVVNLTNGKVFSVFTGHDGIVDAVFGMYGSSQQNGHWYGYFGGVTYGDRTRDTHGYADLYRVDLDTGHAEIMAKGDEKIGEWLVGPDGQVIARSRYDEKSGDWSVDAGSFAGATLISGRAPFGGADIWRGRTPETVLIARPDDKDSTTYEEAPLAGGAAKVVGDDLSFGHPIIDRYTHLWIGQTSEGDRPEATFFDPALDARMQAVRQTFAGLYVRFVSVGPKFNRFIVFTSGTGDSGTYWLVDLAAHSANPLGYEYPDAQPADVGPIRMVEWQAADGLKLHGVLSLPPGREAKNLPVVVLPHGGPQARDYPRFDWWVQAFASRGYAVFQPNFRGSDGYGDVFRDAGFGEWGRKMQTDISDGLAELARQGIVDPKRACIDGGSYGGYAALAGVTVQHGLYRCAVSVAGVSDLPGMIDYAGVAGNSATRYWRKFMGSTSTFGGELAVISPRRIAARADAPILLIHGSDDTVVPLSQSIEMAEALKAAGKPFEFITVPGADHWYLHEDARLTMITKSVAFVEKYNPPDPTPGPASVSSATSAPTP